VVEEEYSGLLTVTKESDINSNLEKTQNCEVSSLTQSPPVYPQGTPCMFDGHEGQFFQGPYGQFVMTNELGPIPATMCVMINGTFRPINFR
jgi:hypothetical protein